MASQHYCLRWNNYQSNMTSVFHQLLRTEAFVDVTLACNDLSLKAHKVVLSACSSYFQKLLLENPCKHPTIIMPPDVCFSDLKFIIEFVYRGEIDVSQAELQSLLKTADQLKIKGLCEVPENRDPIHCEEENVGTGSLSSRRSFTKLRRLSGSKRQRGPDPVRRALFNEEVNNVDVDLTDLDHDRGCVTVATSTDEDQTDMPIVLLDNKLHIQSQIANKRAMVGNGPPPIPSPQQQLTSMDPHSANIISRGDPVDVEIAPEAQPPAPSATLVENLDIIECSGHNRIQVQDNIGGSVGVDVVENVNDEDVDQNVTVKFETLRAMEQADAMDMDAHEMSDRNVGDGDHAMHTMMITPELLGLIPSSSGHSDISTDTVKSTVAKSWTHEDMELALDALRNHNMSLTKASATYGIPSTTLWQRAHRLGIDTPKKEGPSKSWTEESLNNALEALRTGSISANKASKAFGIPSSTLYKIARKEGIRLAAPFNAAPTTWSPDDLERALVSIRSGATSVQRASTEFGIPTGTLYGRCKKEGIELSRSNPTPWSEGAMGEALEAVRVGQMSINQAAIHYNLPYSSLYGRFKRSTGKYEQEHHQQMEEVTSNPSSPPPPQIMVVQYQQHTQLQQQQHQHANMYQQQSTVDSKYITIANT